MLSVEQAFEYAQSKLREHEQEDSALEAREIVRYCKNYSLEEFFFNFYSLNFSKKDKILLDNIVARRIKGEPLAYLLQKQSFYGRDFFVNKKVLIPRSDTEILVSSVLNDYNSEELETLILDLGTGSGCILITLLLENKNFYGYAVDITENAIDVAKKNARLHNVFNKIIFFRGDWFNALKKVSVKFDVIVSNPPYICKNTEQFLMSKNTKYEPDIALYSTGDKCSSYLSIANNVDNFLAIKGHLYVEIGLEKQRVIDIICNNSSLKYVKCYKDIEGRDRCLKFVKDI